VFLFVFNAAKAAKIVLVQFLATKWKATVLVELSRSPLFTGNSDLAGVIRLAPLRCQKTRSTSLKPVPACFSAFTRHQLVTSLELRAEVQRCRWRTDRASEKRQFAEGLPVRTQQIQ
jgi:hypothetical protein